MFLIDMISKYLETKKNLRELDSDDETPPSAKPVSRRSPRAPQSSEKNKTPVRKNKKDSSDSEENDSEDEEEEKKSNLLS